MVDLDRMCFEFCITYLGSFFILVGFGLGVIIERGMKLRFFCANFSPITYVSTNSGQGISKNKNNFYTHLLVMLL